MRLAVIRTDIRQAYLADVENRSQRCFSSQPPGQSRYLEKPTDAQLLAVLNGTPILANYAGPGMTLVKVGTDLNATVNTSAGTNNILKIRTTAAAAYTTVTCFADAAATKVRLAADLNAGFVAAGLPVQATVLSTNAIQLDTVPPDAGPAGYVELSAAGAGLEAVLGIATAAVTGISLVTFKNAIYGATPWDGPVDVSTATLDGLNTGNVGLLQADQKASLYYIIREMVAPRLIETGQVLLSFVYGNIAHMAAATFQPGGGHVRRPSDGALLPAGAFISVLADDGVTLFQL